MLFILDYNCIFGFPDLSSQFPYKKMIIVMMIAVDDIIVTEIEGAKHNSLYDARVIRKIYRICNG